MFCWASSCWCSIVLPDDWRSERLWSSSLSNIQLKRCITSECRHDQVFPDVESVTPPTAPYGEQECTAFSPTWCCSLNTAPGFCYSPALHCCSRECNQQTVDSHLQAQFQLENIPSIWSISPGGSTLSPICWNAESSSQPVSVDFHLYSTFQGPSCAREAHSLTFSASTRPASYLPIFTPHSTVFIWACRATSSR